VLNEMAKFVEDHVLMAAHEFFVFVLLRFEHTLEESRALLKEVFFGLAITLGIGVNTILLVHLCFSLAPLDRVVNLNLDYKVNALFPVGTVTPDAVVEQQSM